MKSFEHLIVLTILIVLNSACSSKANQSNIQKETSDSVKTDSVASEPVVNEAFSSPDLIMNELKGHVKTCETFFYDASLKDGEYTIKDTKVVPSLLAFTKEGYMSQDKLHHLTYDAQGKLIEGRYLPNKDMRIHIKRNKAGYMDTLTCEYKTGEECDSGYRIEYKWNDKNQLTEANCIGWEWGYRNEYTYNEKGLCEKSINTSFPDYEEQIDDTRTYIYTQFDDKGNWIVRNVQSVSITTTTDLASDESTKSAAHKSYYVEKRVIHYY